MMASIRLQSSWELGGSKRSDQFATEMHAFIVNPFVGAASGDARYHYTS